MVLRSGAKLSTEASQVVVKCQEGSLLHIK